MSKRIDTPDTVSINDDSKIKAEPEVDATRRTVLKGAAAIAGAAGAQAITGFPLIWAQDIKNIEFLVTGWLSFLIHVVLTGALFILAYVVICNSVEAAKHKPSDTIPVSDVDHAGSPNTHALRRLSTEPHL